MSKCRIAWNVTRNNDNTRYELSIKYECEVYKFKFKSLKEPKWNMFFSSWQKGLVHGRNSILHKHFGVCKSFNILDLSN